MHLNGAFLDELLMQTPEDVHIGEIYIGLRAEEIPQKF